MRIFHLALKSKYRYIGCLYAYSNKAMDKVFYKMRSRFNAKLIAATSYLKDFKQYSKERFCLIFVGDQSAGNTERLTGFLFLVRLRHL